MSESDQVARRVLLAEIGAYEDGWSAGAFGDRYAPGDVPQPLEHRYAAGYRDGLRARLAALTPLYETLGVLP